MVIFTKEPRQTAAVRTVVNTKYIQGEGNILVDVLLRIYDGLDADVIVDQDYLQKEGNYINMNTFLPNSQPSD